MFAIDDKSLDFVALQLKPDLTLRRELTQRNKRTHHFI